MKTNYGAPPHSNGGKVSLREKPVCGHCGMPYTHHHPSGQCLRHKPSEIEPPKQAYPNHNWCEGCTPENCSGCGTAPLRHPLHSEEWVARLEAMEPGGYTRHHHRATGRSTAIALQTIARAIRTPYQPIAISDHHPGTIADRYLMDTIRKMINQLGLRELYVLAMKDGGGYWLQFGKTNGEQER